MSADRADAASPIIPLETSVRNEFFFFLFTLYFLKIFRNFFFFRVLLFYCLKNRFLFEFSFVVGLAL